MKASDAPPTTVPATSRIGLLLLFGVLKGVSYASPLVLGNVLPRATYGGIEYALSAGTVVAGLLALGLPAAIPYLLLRRQDARFQALFRAHRRVALGIAAVGLACAWATSGAAWTLALSVSGLATAQLTAIAEARSAGANVAALVHEASLYLWLAALVVARVTFPDVDPMSLIQATLTLTVGMLWAWELARPVPREGSVGDLGWGEAIRQTLAIGAPTLVAGFLVGLVTSGGRLLIGRVAGVEAVADYSQVFRVAGGLLIVHQIGQATMFRQMYVADGQDLDRRHSAILGLVVLGGASLVAVVASPLANALPAFAAAVARAPALPPLLCAHVVLWIASALNEAVVYREQATRIATLLVFGWLAVLVAGTALLSWRHAASLTALVSLQLAALGGHVASQYLLLSRRGVALPKAAALICTATIAAVGTAAWISAR